MQREAQIGQLKIATCSKEDAGEETMAVWQMGEKFRLARARVIVSKRGQRAFCAGHGPLLT